MQIRPYRRRRSVLYVPATNEKALAKLPSLACDAVILDLEDAVAPADKGRARDNLARLFAAGRPFAGETVIRINALAGDWGAEDMVPRSLAGRMPSCCPRWKRPGTSSRRTRRSTTPIRSMARGSGQ